MTHDHSQPNLHKPASGSRHGDEDDRSPHSRHHRRTRQNPQAALHGGDHHQQVTPINADHDHAAVDHGGEHDTRFGHGGHGDHAAQFRNRFWLSLVLTIPVVIKVPVAELAADDVVLVRSGARVPADGVVVSGASAMDESMITGESRPLTGHEGDRVVAGTVATDNSIRVRVTAASEETALAGIQRLVGEAQRSHARAQALADRAAAFLSYFAAGTGLITFTAWTVLGNTGEADPGHLAHASA